MWLLFLHRNKGILAFLRTRSMVFASLTYLDSLNMYICIMFLQKSFDGIVRKKAGFYRAQLPILYMKLSDSGSCMFNAIDTSIGDLPSENSLYACVDWDIFSACSLLASFSSIALFRIAPISLNDILALQLSHVYFCLGCKALGYESFSFLSG